MRSLAYRGPEVQQPTCRKPDIDAADAKGVPVAPRDFSHRLVYALLAVALIAGSYARIAHLDRKLFWQDEAFAALMISGHNVAQLEALYDGRRRAFSPSSRGWRRTIRSTRRSSMFSTACRSTRSGVRPRVIARSRF